MFQLCSYFRYVNIAHSPKSERRLGGWCYFKHQTGVRMWASILRTKVEYVRIKKRLMRGGAVQFSAGRGYSLLCQLLVLPWTIALRRVHCVLMHCLCSDALSFNPLLRPMHSDAMQRKCACIAVTSDHLLIDTLSTHSADKKIRQLTSGQSPLEPKSWI